MPIDTELVQTIFNFLLTALTESLPEIIKEVCNRHLTIHKFIKLFIQDGPMCFDNQGGAPNYYPNSFSGPEPSQRARKLEPAYKVTGDVYRFDSGDEDNFTQARAFWSSVLDAPARHRLVNNIAGHLKDAAEFIQVRVVVNFNQVSPEFGQQLKKTLKIYRGEIVWVDKFINLFRLGTKFNFQ